MPTDRLYFDDAYLQFFSARVTQHGSYRGQPAAVLDRSAFYPEGGGQPGDRGTLNGIAVLDTQADAAGDVWHIVAEPLTSDEVQGQIDWSWRFDFMQQHHGQHLLSAACEELLEAQTIAVHLGLATCTVDFAVPHLTMEQWMAIEDRTNEMIWANVPIYARFVTPEELRTLSLRKAPQAYDRIRIVSAGDFDHSPCGGTHPRHTGEVGSVVLRRWERYKGGVRIEFICGRRALHDYRAKNQLLVQLASASHVAQAELPAVVDRLRTAEERQRKELAYATSQLIDYEAATLVAKAEQVHGVPVVVHGFAERSLDELRLLARKIVERGSIALLGLQIVTPEPKAQLVFMRPPELPNDMSKLLKVAAVIVGGRGGGKLDAAQGGGPVVGRLDEALAAALAQLEELAQ